VQLLLILQKLLLVKLGYCGSLHLQFLYTFDDLDTMKTDSDSKVSLQILISYVIQKRPVNTQSSYRMSLRVLNSYQTNLYTKGASGVLRATQPHH
jgi:hypothetical protein